MTWTSDLLGINEVFDDGVEITPERDAINFVSGSGVNVLVSDNPVTLRKDVTFSSVAGGIVGGGSATTDVLQWDGTAWVATSNPNVASISVGSPLPSIGALRVANGIVAVASRTTGGVDLNLAYANSSDVILLGDPDAASITLDNSDVIMNRFLRFPTSATGPKISQDTLTADTAPQNLTLAPQAPFASATGTNRNPGSVIVDNAAPTNGGTVDGFFECQRAATRYFRVSAYPSAPATGLLWLGSATPTTSNPVLQSDGATGTTVSGPSGGSLNITTGGSLANGFYVRATSLGWAYNSSRFFQQDGQISDTATFDTTYQAQTAYVSATGTNRNGGHLKLVGGVKATGGVDGSVRMYSGGSHIADFRLIAGVSGLAFNSAVSGNVFVNDPASDVAPQPLTLSGANAYASASTNINGAACEIYGGLRKSGSAGLSGPVRLELEAVPGVELTEVATTRRVLALCRFANITTTELPANTGDGVVYLGNVVSAPTASPVSGGIGWANSGQLRWREPNGAISDAVYRAVSTGGTTKQCERRCDDLQTTDATVTTILTVTIPDNSVVEVIVNVQARNQTTAEQAAYHVRHAARRRAAGSAALLGTIAKDSFEEDATWDVATAVSGNDLLIQVTGEAAQTIDWLAWAEIYTWTP